MQATVPPGFEAPVHDRGELGNELATLRSHLRLIEELDQQTTEMVLRLAEAARSSAEVRAQVSLEIDASLQRVGRLLSDRQHRQREVIAALREDVTVALANATGLATAVRGIENDIAGLRERLSAVADRPDDAAPPVPVTVADAPVTPRAPDLAERLTAIAPLPAATSLLVDVEQVPSASVALSIQRFVTGLPGVVAATTREYAAGHLRLEVMSRGGVSAAEIGNWPGGHLEIVEHRADGLAFRVNP